MKFKPDQCESFTRSSQYTMRCKRKGFFCKTSKKYRCPNHAGLSTGPKTKEGKLRKEQQQQHEERSNQNNNNNSNNHTTMKKKKTVSGFLVNGYLVDIKNPEQLADKMYEMLINPKLRMKMGEESFKIVSEQFSIDLVIEKTLKVYELT